MSTYLYLECLDHDPPLRADGESGQHLHDLPDIRYDITHRKVMAELWSSYAVNPSNHFRANSAKFLADHATCRVGIRDEYGDTYPLVEGEPS